MTPELTRVATLLEALPEVEVAYVFGSLATGKASADSDLDIAVTTSQRLTAEQRQTLIEQLAVVSGRPVDLVDLPTAGEPVTGEILRDGVRLKGSNEQHATIMARHIFDTEDFMPYLKRLLKERREAWIP